MKKIQLQLTLLIAAAVYMGWGLALLIAPTVAHDLISTGPYDAVSTAMFGTALLGFMVTFLIAARDPVKEIVRAAAAAMALIGLVAAFLVFGAKAMPLNFVTFSSVAVDLACAGILFLTEGKLDIERHAKVGAKLTRVAAARKK